MSLFSVRAAVLMAEAVKASMPKGSKAYILFNQIRRATLVGQQDTMIGWSEFKRCLSYSF